MRHWKVDPDIAGLREGRRWPGLPDVEQPAWRALWARVERLLIEALEKSS